MTTNQKQYQLEGLCCGKCAAKIQKDVAFLEGVVSAEVNADTGILSIAFDGDANTLAQTITAIAVSHEEAIVIKEI